MSGLERLRLGIISGHRDEAVEGLKRTLDEGIDPRIILSDGLIKAMDTIGSKFEKGLIYLPEMLAASIAMKSCMIILQPHLKAEAGLKSVRFLIGSAHGDLHDIGKNLVASMMEGAGLKVIDLGVDVPPIKFFDAAISEKVDIVGISALLTTTMPSMKQTVDLFEKKGVRNKVKIIVGGAPVTEKFARDIGADGYAPDAVSAVRVVKQWL